MKTTLLLTAVLALFHIGTASAGKLPNQPVSATVSKASQPGFAFVRSHRQGKGATVTWAMDSNTDIIGFDVECTTQDPNDPYSVWEYKGSVTVNSRRMFSFNDTNVLPGILNYRIIAYLADGSSVVSDIESLRLVSR